MRRSRKLGIVCGLTVLALGVGVYAADWGYTARFHATQCQEQVGSSLGGLISYGYQNFSNDTSMYLYCPITHLAYLEVQDNSMSFNTDCGSEVVMVEGCNNRGNNMFWCRAYSVGPTAALRRYNYSYTSQGYIAYQAGCDDVSISISGIGASPDAYLLYCRVPDDNNNSVDESSLASYLVSFTTCSDI